MARYMDEDDREAMADFMAEMREQDMAEVAERRPSRSWSSMSYAEKCRDEGFPDFEAGVQNAGCYD